MNLADIYGKEIKKQIIPFYPVYTELELLNAQILNDPHYYEYNNSTVTNLLSRNAQAGRIQAIGCNSEIHLPKESNIPIIRSYFANVFGTDQIGDGKDIIWFEGRNGFVENVESNPSLIVPLQPFISQIIDPNTNKYYICPNKLSEVNNKLYLGEYAHQTPARMINVPIDQIYEQAHIFIYMYNREQNHGIAIKNNSSSGGEGVLILRNLEDVYQQCINKFGTNTHLIIEQLITPIYSEKPIINYNVQMLITENGDISCLGYSVQRVYESGEHLGNVMPIQQRFNDLPKAVQDNAYKSTEKCYQQKLYGLVGWDILFDPSDEDNSYNIDPNFRLNASTPAQIFRPIMKNSGYINSETYGLYPVEKKSTVEDLFKNKTFKKYLDNLGIITYLSLNLKPTSSH